jgi:bifunctional NMN adenylyltransferase/nudix hydrolase
MLNIKGPAGDLGVIVARFQTPQLTPGHRELIDTVKARHRKVMIVLGVARVIPTKKNPLDFATRLQMLQDVYPGIEVLPINDQRDNTVWSKNLDQLVRAYHPHEQVVMYGGRDSFAQCYSGRFAVVELEAALGESGTQARQQAFHTVRNTEDFRAGICYAVANRYAIKNPTVDVAVMRGNELLLAHKKEDGASRWRFVGGHIDLGETGEQAARREVQEETGVSISKLEYITSATIDDWRYTGSGDGIFTTLFLGHYAYGAARAADDVQDARWFAVDRITPDVIVPEHRALFEALMNKLAERKCQEVAQ